MTTETLRDHLAALDEDDRAALTTALEGSMRVAQGTPLGGVWVELCGLVNELQAANEQDRRQVEGEAETAALMRATEQWQAGRTAAARAGADEAERKLRWQEPSMATPPRVHSERREGYHRAGVEYERTHPRPDSGAGPVVPLVFISDADHESPVHT